MDSVSALRRGERHAIQFNRILKMSPRALVNQARRYPGLLPGVEIAESDQARADTGMVAVAPARLTKACVDRGNPISRSLFEVGMSIEQ